jgi:hypothetical protein
VVLSSSTSSSPAPAPYKDIAPLFSVANSKQEFQALLITKGSVRGDAGNEKYAKNLYSKSSYGGKVFSMARQQYFVYRRF